MPAQVEKMAYAGDVPWHGIGRKVEGLMTAQEAIKAAELDWEVMLKPVYVNGQMVKDYNAIVRNTDQSVFAIVGNRYVPIQNADAFRFFDSVVGGGYAYYETVGALDGGRKIWMLANLKDTISIKGDGVKKYVVLTQSHDGTWALQMFWTPIRVVCMNTLAAAMSAATTKFYTRHTIGAIGKIDAAKEILGFANVFYQKFQENMDRLASKQLKAADMPLMLKAAFGIPLEQFNDIYNPVKIQMDKVEELVTIDRKEYAPHLQGTVYEAYNAVVKFTDYYRPYRGGKPENRLNGVWFGSGNIVKNRALDWAMAYTK